MLHIHFANRYDTLTALLLANLGSRETGRGSVFGADQLIVPSAAVRRSLTLAIADHDDGICANVRFDFLARWLWQQIGRLVPTVGEESPFSQPVLSWRIYTALGDPEFVAGHPRLAAYLQKSDEVMRYELACRVAGLLEQYVTYRDDWLEAWRQGQTADLGRQEEAAGEDERWQAALWRRITAETGLASFHPATAFAEALQRGGPDAAAKAGLPSSAHLFALPTMPPLHIRMLEQLGRSVDLHLYVLNPCQEYWFEVIDRRRLTHLATRGRAESHEEGNRLLAAWGRQTQSHVDLLVDSFGETATDDAHFEPHSAGTLLARVQNAMLDLTELDPGSVTLAVDDRSLEVHVCHSLTRELEVLQDHLLGLFAKGTSAGSNGNLVAGAILQPSDILVVTPDLEAAAPMIDAVFGTTPKDRFIPYTVTGRARSTVNVPARALLALLTLAGSRFAASAVFGLLQQAIVSRRFGLDDDAMQQVHDWMRESGMRWALDANHRASFEVPAEARHTLADGLDRLFLGYALPEKTGEPFGGVLPSGNAEGSDAVALGAFWRFVDALQRLHAAVSVAQPPSGWVTLLIDVIDTFMRPVGDEVDDLGELQDTIRELVDTMRRAGVTEPVPLPVVRTALEQLLDDPARGGVPTGSVTFSSMSSLRNLPFAVICVIGLNDGVFPTASRPPEFDLIALHPRRGDRQRRDDERNLFLDLLLAARRSFYLSYNGRSVRDNAPLPPSVLVSELLETVIPAVAEDPGSSASLASARRRLVVEHPLQPFSVEGFEVDGDPRLRSFNRELGEALRRSLVPGQELNMIKGMPVPDIDVQNSDEERDEDDAGDPLHFFFGARLDAPGPEWREVSVEQLVRFFGNPSSYLLKNRLGIDLQRDAEDLQDDEPFLPDWPGRSALARRLLPLLLEGADAANVRSLALAGTEMPGGTLGARQLERELDSLTQFAQRVREATAEPCLTPHQASIEIDLDGESWHVRAGFADLRPSGLVRWRYDQKRASDALGAWLHHLVLCADPPVGTAPRTQWLCLDEVLRLKTPDHPAAILRDLLRIYRRGLCGPVRFFPKSAWAYAESGGKLSKATSTWQVTKDRPFGEASDASYRLALRGHADPLDNDFVELARMVFDPLLAHVDAEAKR
jgi:exodeoxyribonuclease V gamma subunit